MAFVGSWVTAGLRTPGYSPITEPISRLAGFGAPQRPLMTSGMLCFAGALPLFALALRDHLPGPAWKAAVGNGLATFAIAAFPVGGSDAIGLAHGAAAITAYTNLAALPLLAAPPLQAAGHPQAARASTITGVVVGAFLAASLTGHAVGLLQRTGLTLGHIWIITAAVALLSDGRPKRMT